MAKIGFVGLGHMGLPMALNLVKAGHEVFGFDLQKDAVLEFVAAGGVAAKTLTEAALGHEFVITMLQTGQQVLDVCLNEGGLYPSILPHHGMHIDCSTIDVSTARILHQNASQHNILSLDAPVSGGVAGAKAARLTFMAGGREYDLQKAEPLLSIMGSKIIHTGNGGSGQAAKICNNMVLGISMIAVSEAFTLAESLDLSAQRLYEVLSHASGHCWVTDNYLPVPDILPSMPADNDFKPGFAVAMMLKDLLLAQQEAINGQVFTPMAERATQLYQLFSDKGGAALDFSAIIQLIGAKME